MMPRRTADTVRDQSATRVRRRCSGGTRAPLCSALVAWLCLSAGAAVVSAQTANADPESAPAPAATQPDDQTPARHPVWAVAEVIAINGLYNLSDNLLPLDNPDHFRISLASWRRNLRRGFGWDDDPFLINQAGHPYQGGSYFSAGRSLGLSFWEAAPLSALGSVTWEYFGETTRPAWNDVLNTSLAGPLIGEVLHRAAWLIRDPRRTGNARAGLELAATVVDPISGLNRLLTGEAWRVSRKPRDLQPASLGVDIGVGVSWHGGGRPVSAANGIPQLILNLDYGRLEAGRAEKPFDAFSLRLGAGSDGVVSATVRGRLISRPLGRSADVRHQLLLVQGYDYESTRAFRFGGPSVRVGIADRFSLSARTDLQTTVLAAFVPVAAANPSFWSATKTSYAYGTGAGLSGSATLRRNDAAVARVSYDAYRLHTLSGATTGSIARALHADLMLPLWQRLRLGLGGDRLAMTVRLKDGTRRAQGVSQLRVYLAWSGR